MNKKKMNGKKGLMKHQLELSWKTWMEANAEPAGDTHLKKGWRPFTGNDATQEYEGKETKTSEIEKRMV